MKTFKLRWRQGVSRCLGMGIGILLLVQKREIVANPEGSNRLPTVVVTIAPSESIELDRTIPVVGTLFARDEATLGAEVEGKLEKTGAELGDRVKAGQEIAWIDTDTYTALANRASALKTQAQAGVVRADHELKRQEELRRDGIASPADLDKSRADADQARAAMQAAEAAEVVSRLNLDHSKVRAPFDAVVAERIGNAGDFLVVGAPLFRIINDSVLKFVVQAPEAYAPLIQKGQTIRFRVDAFPGRVFQGQVFLISPQVSLTTRMFSLGAIVQNQERLLKANTFAQGELVLEAGVPAVVVPLESVIVSAGVRRIWIVEGGHAHSKQVEVGRILQSRQEIISGLKAGESVVTSGHGKLREGTPVELRIETSEHGTVGTQPTRL